MSQEHKSLHVLVISEFGDAEIEALKRNNFKPSNITMYELSGDGFSTYQAQVYNRNGHTIFLAPDVAQANSYVTDNSPGYIVTSSDPIHRDFGDDMKKTYRPRVIKSNKADPVAVALHLTQ